jgi:hypothetical protein
VRALLPVNVSSSLLQVVEAESPVRALLPLNVSPVLPSGGSGVTSEGLVAIKRRKRFVVNAASGGSVVTSEGLVANSGYDFEASSQQSDDDNSPSASQADNDDSKDNVTVRTMKLLPPAMKMQNL